MAIDLSKTTWDLSTLFTSDEDPRILECRQKYIDGNNKFIDKWKNRMDFVQDPKILCKALDEWEELSKFYDEGGDEVYYFMLRNALNQEDPLLKARLNK